MPREKRIREYLERLKMFKGTLNEKISTTDNGKPQMPTLLGSDGSYDKALEVYKHELEKWVSIKAKEVFMRRFIKMGSLMDFGAFENQSTCD